MSDHSILPPSSAARRLQCSGSTLAEAQYPEEESDEAKQGTAAHWGGAEMLHGNVIAEGLIAPNGVYLTEEMVEGAELWFDDVAAELAPYGLHPSQGRIEQRVAIPRVHPQSWGTPDYRIWLPQSKRLVVYDYKFGYRPVDAYGNAQCIEYAAGALDELGYDWNDGTWLVTIKIVQPRAHHRDGPVRAWTTRAVDLRPHIQAASDAAHEALGPSPTYRVGPECRDCQARHACPTLQSAALSACDLASKAPPLDMPVAAMAREYRTLIRNEALLSARMSGLQAQLLSLGKAGKQLPGLRIEHGAGREVWSIPDDNVIAIGTALGVNVARQKPMTPKQAIKAGLPEAVLAGITNTPRGEAKLVEDDGSLARKVFGS